MDPFQATFESIVGIFMFLLLKGKYATLFLMQQAVNWVKNNKLSSFLFLIIAVILLVKIYSPLSSANRSYPASIGEMSKDVVSSPARQESLLAYPVPADEYAPQPDVDERKVVNESSVSLLVKNVLETQNKIVNYVDSIGGYMVYQNTYSPEDGDTGYISVRVPTAKMQGTLKFLEQQAVRVVSTSLNGRDVTDEYINIEERLAVLNATKAKLQQIQNQATVVADIIEVQRELTNLQQQIDSLQGRQELLNNTSDTALITVNLSTDELSLPYAPGTPWRPQVVFKTAVRQLLLTLRGVGNLAIWLVVYSVVWVPISLFIFFGPKIIKKIKAKS